MKMTLLEMVQDILSDMSDDEVNSIEDTMSSIQVAQIIRTTYFAMMSNKNWPHQRKIIQLTASGTTDRPTHMSLPDNVKEIVTISYDRALQSGGRKQFEKVTYKAPDEFLRHLYQRDGTQDNVLTIEDTSGSELFIYNDRPPTYYTSIDDTIVIFDSFNQDLESTLMSSKTQVIAYVMPGWTHEDNFVPDLPTDAFIALLEESKSRSCIKLAQRPDQKSEIESRRQQTWLAQRSFRVAGGIKYQSYGRGRNSYPKDPTFENNT